MIVLMRHALVQGGEGRCIGRTELPLSGDGRKQAHGLAEIFYGIGFNRLCSSPARRALDSVAPFSEVSDLQVEVFEGLREIDMGVWDGLPFDEIRERFPQEYAARAARFGEYRVLDGESFNEVADRAMAVLAELAGGTQPVLAATHAGVIRAVLCRLTGHPMDDLFRFRPEPLDCTVIRPDRGGLTVIVESVRPMELARMLNSSEG